MSNDSNAKIINRIRQRGRGWAFSPKDFLELGSRTTIDVTLSKLASEGMIRRIVRGIYDYPRFRESLGGELSPDIEQVAQAIARRFRWRIVPDGALAANMIGLSTQVPAKIVYLSDGPGKTVRIAHQAIRFKHARPQQTSIEDNASAVVIQALRHIGRARVDSKVIDKLRRRLSATEKKRLLLEARYAADWIHDVARKIAEDSRT